MTDNNEVIVSRQQLYEMVWRDPITRVAEDLGVPYGELRNACKRLAVPCPSSGYWEKVRAGKVMGRPELPELIGPQQLPIFRAAEKATPEQFQVIIVSPGSSNQLHPLVEETKRSLMSPRGKFSILDTGHLRQDRERALTCKVSAQQVDRALSIWEAIVRSGEASGLSFSIRKDRTYASAFGHEMWIRLFESVRQEPDGRRTRDVPTGRLRFFTDGPFADISRFTDVPGKPLEQQIDKIIRKCLRQLYDGIAKQRKNDLWRLEYKRTEEACLKDLAERKAREEAEKRMTKAVAESTEALLAMLHTWAIAKQISSYFEEAISQVSLLPPDDQKAILERIARARVLLGEDGALERLRAWRTPEERARRED